MVNAKSVLVAVILGLVIVSVGGYVLYWNAKIPLLTHPAQFPRNGYTFIELKNVMTTEVMGDKEVSRVYVDFPTYEFDATQGELSPYYSKGFYPELQVNDTLVAILGEGVYAYGQVVVGASTRVHGIYSLSKITAIQPIGSNISPIGRIESISELEIMNLSEDGSVKLKYMGETIILKQGEIWKGEKVFVAECNWCGGADKPNVSFAISSSIENFGLQDKSKIKTG